MIKTEMLIYLTEVARFNSITAAANSLIVTPSAITHSLKQLKDELGGNINIYERTNNGIVFTEIGKNLVDVANSILKNMDLMKRMANNEIISDPASNLPAIASNIILCANLGVSSALVDLPLILHERYPCTNFSMIDLPYHKMLSNINADNETFGVAYIMDEHLSDLDKYTNIDYELLHTSNLGIKTAEKSKFIPDGINSITLKQLSELPIVLNTYNSSLQNQFLQMLLPYNSELNMPFSSANIETTLRIVNKDLAVLFSSGFTSPAEKNEAMQQYKLRFIPVSEHIYVHIAFLYNKNADNQTLRVLAYYLSQYLGNVYL